MKRRPCVFASAVLTVALAFVASSACSPAPGTPDPAPPGAGGSSPPSPGPSTRPTPVPEPTPPPPAGSGGSGGSAVPAPPPAAPMPPAAAPDAAPATDGQVGAGGRGDADRRRADPAAGLERDRPRLLPRLPHPRVEEGELLRNRGPAQPPAGGRGRRDQHADLLRAQRLLRADASDQRQAAVLLEPQGDLLPARHRASIRSTSASATTTAAPSTRIRACAAGARARARR